MIDGGAWVREAEEAEEDDVEELGGSGLGSQRERGCGGVVVRVEEEGAGVGVPTPEESSGSSSMAIRSEATKRLDVPYLRGGGGERGGGED
ncbi:hypothetical protein TRIUR3_29945 [Triticum urartu]|uniref:Uncharacterized protein n=1 Tax=Triticum urartu TaxID=4572 RepID=M7Y4C7_TRIUA|nr:hypothetical protein TRIUR3_29945 [Triticum urartu]